MCMLQSWLNTSRARRIRTTSPNPSSITNRRHTRRLVSLPSAKLQTPTGKRCSCWAQSSHTPTSAHSRRSSAHAPLSDFSCFGTAYGRGGTAPFTPASATLAVVCRSDTVAYVQGLSLVRSFPHSRVQRDEPVGAAHPKKSHTLDERHAGRRVLHRERS